MPNSPIKAAVLTASTELFESIRKYLPAEIAQLVQVVPGASATTALPAGVNLVFLDGAWPHDIRALLESTLGQTLYTCLVDEESHVGREVPDLLALGLADDLLLLPIRPVELLSKVKHVIHLQRVGDVVAANATLRTLIERFEEDLDAARSIQRTLIPEKFAPVHGLKVAHKYLSGFKSGGDYLDFFEFPDKTHVGLLMSDSTGYGLSSAFMSVIVRLTMKLAKDDQLSPSAMLKKVWEELQVTLKPTEQLSVFYGVLNRKTFEMKYSSFGGVGLFVASDSKKPLLQPISGDALLKGAQVSATEHRLRLEPGERLVLVSDGFAETFGEPAAFAKNLEKLAAKDAMALVNDLVFRIKSGLESEDDMPAQDCSVMVVDVEKRAMRLAN